MFCDIGEIVKTEHFVFLDSTSLQQLAAYSMSDITIASI